MCACVRQKLNEREELNSIKSLCTAQSSQSSFTDEEEVQRLRQLWYGQQGHVEQVQGACEHRQR